MNGSISIVSSESDIDVRYGMFDLGLEREGARTSFKYILSDIGDIKKSYFRLGFHLNEFKTCQYYKDFGYLTFEEFCNDNLDMDKGSISRCINVFLMTNSSKEVTYKAGVKIVGCGSCMSEKYKDYSYSQLCEMLSLKDEERSLVTPNMTIKDIRNLKKGKNEKVATSQPDDVRLCVSDLITKKGVELQHHIKICQSIRNEIVELYDRDGKLIGRYECDLLMSGNDGVIGKRYYRIFT